MQSAVSQGRRRFFVIWSFVMPVLMAIPVGVGFLFPQTRSAALVAAIVVTIVVGFICYGATITRTLSKWVLGVLLVFSVIPFMLGSAEVGPNLALEKAGERVKARVTDIQREERRSGDDSSVTYTYSFERLDGGPIPGTIVYRDDGGYDGLFRGATTTLLVDPTGRLEPQLLSEVDSSSSLGMLVFGVIATGVTWVLVASPTDPVLAGCISSEGGAVCNGFLLTAPRLDTATTSPTQPPGLKTPTTPAR